MAKKKSMTLENNTLDGIIKRGTKGLNTLISDNEEVLKFCYELNDVGISMININTEKVLDYTLEKYGIAGNDYKRVGYAWALIKASYTSTILAQLSAEEQKEDVERLENITVPELTNIQVDYMSTELFGKMLKPLYQPIDMLRRIK